MPVVNLKSEKAQWRTLFRPGRYVSDHEPPKTPHPPPLKEFSRELCKSFNNPPESMDQDSPSLFV
jgi:hypothetical protein